MDKFRNAGFLLEKLMDSTQDSIYFKDLQSRFMILNEACATKLGWNTPAEGVGKSDADIFSGEHAGEAYADEQRIIATGEPLIGIEEKETWPDGRITWCSTSKMPLTDENGKIIGIVGITRDITDRKEAELRAARFAEQIRHIKEDMEDDVRMAAELQKTFYPDAYPAFPKGASADANCVEFSHYSHASGLISGDICTIRRLSETTAGILLCDVMGHGVRAALGTALICAMVEELSPQESDPGKFLELMNHQLMPMLHREEMLMFATACYAVFDVSTGILRMANAGHPIPLHVRASENTATWMMDDPDQRGCALAISEDAAYQTFESQLQPGDSMIMFTDGLYEAERDDGEEFGEERLLVAAQRLSASPLTTLFPALMNEACLFAKEAALADDVCLVGFNYKQPMQQ
jgi:sigma-B regulation protein RsbU (phosphoserine phosphatase)